VGRVHRRSTLSSPAGAASRLIGILLPPVSRITPLVFSLLTWMLDIDRVSLVSAHASINWNGLSERIALLRADPTGPLYFRSCKTRLPRASRIVQNCIRNLLWDVDLISACVIRRFMQARRRLRGRRPRRGSYPARSVHSFLPFPNNILNIIFP
jgi:hypothetical protein